MVLLQDQVLVKLIGVYHLLVLVYHGDHLVLKLKMLFGFLLMV